MERAPELSSNEEVLALDNASTNGLLDALTDLVLISVAEGSVDVTISRLDSVLDSVGDLTRARLPCSQTKGRDLSAGVELKTDVCSSHCVRFYCDIIKKFD